MSRAKSDQEVRAERERRRMERRRAQPKAPRIKRHHGRHEKLPAVELTERERELGLRWSQP